MWESSSLNHGGQHSHHAISLQPNCMILGQHAQHRLQGAQRRNTLRKLLTMLTMAQGGSQAPHALQSSYGLTK